MSIKTAIVAVCGLASLCVVAQGSIFEKAASNIEAYRKADATVRFQRRDGTKPAGVTVRVKQLTHDFHFGNLIRPRHYNNETYLRRFKELFNFAELLEFNWGQYEPDEGKPLFAERMSFIRDWCIPNGVTNFYGHMLVWTSQYGRYPKTALPLWLFNYDKARQYQLLKMRIQREVTDYKDISIVWDVVNEAVHCRVWGDWDKDSYVQNRHAEPLERTASYVKDALTWAHQADPNAQLLINDYRVIVKGTFRDRFKRLLEYLLKEGVGLSAVGIQAHEPNKGKYWYSPQELWETYDLFGTELGLPIYITEFFYVSDTTRQIQGSYRSGYWNEQLQADAVEEFYRISFGHPRVNCIIYFGLSDDDVVQPKCGLLDEGFAPKPAWHRLRHLICQEWTTRQSGVTSEDGAFHFKGFYGRYKIQLDCKPKERTFTIHLAKGRANHWTLTVD